MNFISKGGPGLPHPLIAALFLLAAFSNTATAQVQRSIINQGFEEPVFNAPDPLHGCVIQTSSSEIPGWQTTHPAQGGSAGAGTGETCGPASVAGPLIEIWRAPFIIPAAAEGQQLAELNAREASRLYQSICLTNGEQVDWQFSHHARNGGNELIQTLAFAISPVANNPALETVIATSSLPRSQAGWQQRTGTYNHGGASGNYTIGFRATTGGSYGNLLDDIQIELTPYVEFFPPATTEPETVTDPTLLPQLRVSGLIPAPVIVNVTVDPGGTAVLGTDFDTPGGGTNFQVTIPAGNYDGTQTIPLGLTVLNDNLLNGNRTIQLSMAADPASYTIASTQVCGGVANATMQHTILDDDAHIRVSKALSTARYEPNDQFQLAIAGLNAPAPVITTGADPLVNGTAELLNVTTSSVYTLSETEVPAGPVDNYGSTWACTNARPGGVPSSGSGKSFTLTPQIGDDISCVFTNAALTPSLTIQKNQSSGHNPATVGDVIGYEILLTNTGTQGLSNVTLSDTLSNGSALAPVLTSGDTNGNSVLDVGEIWRYTVNYTVIQADVAQPSLLNTATVTTTQTPTPQSDTVTTDLSVTPIPSIVKTQVGGPSPVTAAGQVIDYQIAVGNAGTQNLTNIQVVDTFPNGTSQAPTYVSGDSNSDQVLDVGETWIYTISYTVSQPDMDPGVALVNTARVVTNQTPTPRFDTETTPLTTAPALAIVKTGALQDDGNGVMNAGDELIYTFTVTNTGNVQLLDVAPSDPGPTFNGVAGTNQLSAMSPASAVVSAGSSQIYTARYVISQTDLDNGGGVFEGVSNTAVANARYGITPLISPPVTAKVTLPAPEPATVTLVKATRTSWIRRGETISFAIIASNSSNGAAAPITITDRLPNGFVFVEGSARVDGVDFTPMVSGRDIVFAGLVVPPRSRIEIGLMLRALPATPPGRYVNVALADDPKGTPAAPPARAEFEIRAEAVFDCSEMIGTVFHDLNSNGYQDEGEPGIAGARLSTVRGTLVTSDAFGRYSIPCAALPDSTIGSNFVLKLDDRTLPSGFTLTTKNPEMVRLTAGKMSEINFGAALGREISLTLNDTAFAPGTAEITTEIQQAIPQLINVLKTEKARLVITLQTSQSAGAEARLSNLIDVVRAAWRAIGEPYALSVETRVLER
jgi:uncharacterized repeat protein (TIGR01451 family)